MKKSFLMLGLAVAAMTSCTNDEVVEVNQSNLIKFESFVNKGTRAVTETTDANFAKFYVFGYYGTTNVFDNVAVTKSNSSTTDGKYIWETSTTDQKEWTANTYQFGAYATKNTSDELENGVSFANGQLTFTDYEAKDADDLVAAVAEVNNASLTNPYVDLTFKHLLSKVKFTFKNVGVQDKDYTMEVSNIVVNGILPQGTCTYSTNGASWQAGGTASTDGLSYVGTTTNISKDSSYESEEHHIIPQTLASITATFTVKFYDGDNALVDEITYSGISLDGDGQTSVISKWESGYIYNYTANLPADPAVIKFTASVEEWTDKEVTDTNTQEGIEF